MADQKNKIQILKDTLSLESQDGFNSVQVEQSILSAAIEKYSGFARVIYPNGYSQQGEDLGQGIPFFSLYEDVESDLMINLINSSGETIKAQSSLDNIRRVVNDMVPRVTMYRVYRDPTNPAKILKEQLIKTTKSAFWNNIYPDETGKVGVRQEHSIYGLTGLDLDFKNANPFAASRMVDVGIKFKFRNVGDIDEPDENGARIRDLLSFSANRASNQSAYDGYSIRLVVGYGPVSSSRLNILSKQKKEAVQYLIDNSKLVLDLELIDYDLTLQQNGQLELTLSYVSYIEDTLKNKASVDVFAGQVSNKAQISEHIGGKDTKTAESLLAAYQVAQQRQSKVEALQTRVALYNRQVRLAAMREIQRKNHGKIPTATNPDASDFDISGRTNFDSSEEISQNDIKRLRELRKDLNGYLTSNHKHVFVEKLDRFSFGDTPLFKVRGQLDEIEEGKEQAKSAYNQKLQELNALLLAQNKVKKYRAILDTLFMGNKIYHVGVPVTDLIIFSNEYKKRFNTLVGNIEGDLPKEDLKAKFESEKKKTADGVASSAKPSEKGKAINKAIVGTDSVAQEILSQIESASESKKDTLLTSLREHLAPPDSAKITDSRIQDIYYVYVGDIIDAVYKTNTGHVGKALDELRLCLALGNITDIRNGKRVSYNIADVPVSLGFFLEFFNKNVIEKDISKYPFQKFLQDLTTQLITPIVNMTKSGRSSEGAIQVKFTSFTMAALASGGKRNPSGFDQGYNPSGSGKLESKQRLVLDKKSNSRREFLNYTNPSVLEVSSTADCWEVIMMYSTSAAGFSANLTQSNNLPAKQALNMKDILSFTMGGTSANAVKEFSFKKVKKKYQAEMMATRAMEENNEYREAWNIYDLDLKMIGNFFIRPGMFFYSKLINAKQSGDPNLAAYLGLEGFYLATQVSHKFDLGSTVGTLDTSIVGKWQSSGVSNTGASQPIPASGVVPGSDLQKQSGESP
jgi:hypothetical protein